MLSLDVDRDPRYCPYRLTVLFERGINPSAYPAHRQFMVLRTGSSVVTEAELMYVGNPTPFADQAAQLVTVGWTTIFAGKDDRPIWLTVTDMYPIDTSIGAAAGIIGAGRRNDSLFAFKAVPGTPVEYAFVTTGVDLTGDGQWSGLARFVARADLNADGRPEYFFHLTAERDLRPRLLFCVDPEPFAVLWQVAASSPIWSDRGFLLTAGSERLMCFLGTAPSNGVADDVFDDRYAYLFTVDAHGRVTDCRAIAEFCEFPWVVRSTSNDVYLCHTRDIDEMEIDSTDFGHYRLSKLRPDFSVVHSKHLDQPLEVGWIADIGLDGNDELVTLSIDGRITIWDSTLTKLAESGPTSLRRYIGALPSFLDDQPVMVFAGLGGTYILDYRLNKLAGYDRQMENLAPLRYDEYGNIVELMTFEHQVSVKLFGIQRQDILDYALALYLDYKIWVLSSLFGLVVGLITVNYRRSLTRRNLDIISAQKRELEKAHLDLQEAQAKIVAAEKYRQAKDIAGGFAHEIRNALFPARGLLARLRSVSALPDHDKFLADAERSVVRAIDITAWISMYANLDSAKSVSVTSLESVVREAMRLHEDAIIARRVNTSVEIEDSLSVKVDKTQLVLALSNLIGNSLNAMEETEEPQLRIRGDSHGGLARLIIRDNGAGVPDDSMERIWDAFYTTRPGKGTGLGLPLVRQIIALNGGDVTLHNHVEGGVEATILIPLTRADLTS